MTTQPTTHGPQTVRLERACEAGVEPVWELLSTAAGLERWWAPDGFETRVSELELRLGGHVRYTMTASSPEQVAFVQSLGMPLANEFRRTFTEVSAPTRLAYVSLIDFIPDHDAYEHLTAIELTPDGDRTMLVMTLDRLHDEDWTREYRDHRERELDKLEAALRRRPAR